MQLIILVLYPFLGALVSYLLSKKGRRPLVIAADLVVITEFLLMLWLFISGARLTVELPYVCGFGLYLVLDGFRSLYVLIACLMWMMTVLLNAEYAGHHDHQGRFYAFMLLTLGATAGVFLSGDLYTTFIFFELMSFTSYVWVAQEENEGALRAAGTYLAVAVIGGLAMLMGLFLLYHYLGTLRMSELMAAAGKLSDKRPLWAAGLCLLAGFGAKAGAFPMHIWLPKAHPVAPAPASALLSGILTKTGVFGILVVTSELFYQDADWGMMMLMIGTVTMFLGAFLALFSIDLKRTLACSSMSQIGFILVGVGMQGLLGAENGLAVHGTLLHMINHSLIKLVLFMAAGVIYMNAHSLDLNRIRGYGRKKQLLKIIFLIGALAIGGIPGFGGYISKTLLHESIVEYGSTGIIKAVEILFLTSGGMTLAYMTKLFIAIFVEKNQDPKLQEQYDTEKHCMDPISTFALGGSALVLLVWGLLPNVMDRAAALGQGLMNLSEFGETVSYFSFECLKGALISIGIGAVLYFVLIRLLLIRDGTYVNVWPKWLDLEDSVYRPLLLKILPGISAVICRIPDSIVDGIAVGLRKTVYKDAAIPHENVEGNALSAFLGHVLNGVQHIRNLFRRHKEPLQKDYVHLMAVWFIKERETNNIITQSISFGLMMFGIGMCVTMIYLLLF